MKLLLKRTFLSENYTIGDLSIGGIHFCATLEDKVRDMDKDGDLDDAGEQKVYGETAIPYGTYEVVLNYSPKFGRKLPRLLNVPSFEGILMHRGNIPEDTSGCILLGENKITGKVINSTPYEIKLVGLLTESQLRGERSFITIV